jgi:hypothetical protein
MAATLKVILTSVALIQISLQSVARATDATAGVFTLSQRRGGTFR